MLEEKGLSYEIVAEFSYMLIMSKDHPLADKPNISYEDLAPYKLTKLDYDFITALTESRRKYLN